MAKTLRILVDGRFTTKNVELSFTELDTNFIEIQDDIDDNAGAIAQNTSDIANVLAPLVIDAVQEANVSSTVLASAGAYAIMNITLTAFGTPNGFSIQGGNTIRNDTGSSQVVEIALSASFDRVGGGGPNNFAIKIYQGAVPVTGRMVDSADQNDWGSGSMSVQATMANNTTVEFRVANLDNGNDVIITDITVKLKAL